MRAFVWAVLSVLVLGLAVSPASAQETIRESSTGKHFPMTVTVTYDDAPHTLSVTGLAVRKKLFFKVYGMAHYMENTDFDNETEALAAALGEEGGAKEIILDFARDVGADKIQGAWREGFEKHASEAEMADIEADMNRFLGYFTSEVKEDQTYVFRWLPGGRVETEIAGVEQPAIDNEVLASVLWRIWLDEGSIVDRDKLVAMIVN